MRRHQQCNHPTHGNGNIYYNTHSNRKPYGCMSFIFDIIMLMITGGFWALWIFVREMRARR